MPDKTRKTISASQTAALFDLSPYTTRFSLYHWLAGHVEEEQMEHSRMTWGKKLQPLVLAAAAEDLRLDLTPNEQDDYLVAKSGAVGCTLDALGAMAADPQKGPGAVEAKCVFDYRVWMQTWDGGKAPPVYLTIQLQTQMMIGDGKTPFEWGVIAVWICGEMKYFQQKANRELWSEIHERAQTLLDDVAMEREPEPFGIERESKVIADLYPEPVEDKVVEIYDDESLDNDVGMYRWAQGQKSFTTKEEKRLKPKVMAAMGDAGTLLVDGYRVRVSRSKSADSLEGDRAPVQTAIRALLAEADMSLDAGHALQPTISHLRKAFTAPLHVKRKGSVRQTVTVEETAPQAPAEPPQTTLAAG